MDVLNLSKSVNGIILKNIKLTTDFIILNIERKRYAYLSDCSHGQQFFGYRIDLFLCILKKC